MGNQNVATKKNTGAKPVGRPSKFTQVLADAICDRIAEGESLRAICIDSDMPNRSTVFLWLANSKDFSDQYARAREAQADKYVEEIIEISDDGTNDTYTTEKGEEVNHDVIARSRLRVDARKWVAARLAPKKYGDRIMQEVMGEGGGPVKTENVHALDPVEAARVYQDLMKQ